MNSFAGRDDFQAAQVRRTQEISPVRQHWASRVESVSPGTGRKNPLARIFRPVPGLLNWRPRPRAVRPGLVSFALRALSEYAVCGLPQCGTGLLARHAAERASRAST